MLKKSCEYCAKEVHDRKFIVDSDDQTSEVVIIGSKAFLEVDKAVIVSTTGDSGSGEFLWDLSKTPINFCPVCGSNLTIGS